MSDPVGDRIRAAGPPKEIGATYAPNKRYAGAALLIIGAMLLMVGAFLPWVTATTGFASFSRNGMEGGDGPFFVGFGIVAVLLAISGIVGKTKLAGWGAVLLGATAAFALWANWTNAIEIVADANVSTGDLGLASLGSGLYSIGAGVVSVIIGGFVLLYAPTSPPPDAAVPSMPDTRVKCPRCAELIQPDAKVCRFCGYELAES